MKLKEYINSRIATLIAENKLNLSEALYINGAKSLTIDSLIELLEIMVKDKKYMKYLDMKIKPIDKGYHIDYHQDQNHGVSQKDVNKLLSIASPLLTVDSLKKLGKNIKEKRTNEEYSLIMDITK